MSWMATTTVLSILSLTTVPTRVFLRLRSLICFVLPAVLCWLFGLFFRRIGWIKEGDLTLE